MARHLIYIRFVPAAVWLMTQIAMAGMVSSAKAEPAELRALAKLLQVDRIALCNAGESGPHQAADQTCPWCQGFSDAVLPDGPTTVANLKLDHAPGLLSCPPKRGSTSAGLAYASRAPPV